MNQINKEKDIYHDVPLDHIFKQFNTSSKGLDCNEAKNRLVKNGPNKLSKKKSFSAFTLFLQQFKNPLVYILIFAMILSFLVGHISDALIIALVVFVTNIIGFIQEYKANKALEELNSTIVYKARVLRNSKLKIIKQEEIVCGDIIEIFPGDIVPADARLFESNDMKISEASLTGESYPSKKIVGISKTDAPLADRENMIYQGTAVNEGTGRAVVVATGKNTEIGKIASMIEDTKEIITPLQKQINDFGKWLGFFLVIINILIFGIGILMGRDPFEMFMISIVLVVSAVPEGLIPAMGIILALGMQKLIKKKGLVRKVISAETLGSVTVICTDKTGTLTEGEMTVNNIVTISQNLKINSDQKNKKHLDSSILTALRIGVLSNNAVIEKKDNQGNDIIVGNVTEKALLKAGLIYNFSRENLELSEERIAEIPFSSKEKIMATLHHSIDDGNIMYVKGAPEKILPLCKKALANNIEVNFDKEKLREMEKKIDAITKQGQRVLAVAYKKEKVEEKKKIKSEDLDELVFVGFFAIKDKIRNDAKEAIALCEKAGVKVAMITGDHSKTAVSIARELGLKVSAKNVLEGKQIDELSDNELKNRISDIIVYARVEPKHKLKIVTLLQENGETVAMTGDGINDAPALKKSDIGVVMNNGTDVAKQVADLVLLDNNFMTIVEAIRQGRTTFHNIRKVIVYLFTDCFQELVIIGTAILASWPLPMLPVQILWIKLIESPLPATSLSFEKAEVNVMKDKPRRKDEQLLDKGLKINIAFYAFMMDIFALVIFYLYWKVGGDLDKARTVMFTALGMSTLFLAYSVRSLRKSIFQVNPFGNKLIVISTFVGLCLFVFAIYSKFMNQVLETVPLALSDWAVIFLYASIAIIIFELGKIFSRNIQAEKN